MWGGEDQRGSPHTIPFQQRHHQPALGGSLSLARALAPSHPECVWGGWHPLLKHKLLSPHPIPTPALTPKHNILVSWQAAGAEGGRGTPARPSENSGHAQVCPGLQGLSRHTGSLELGFSSLPTFSRGGGALQCQGQVAEPSGLQGPQEVAPGFRAWGDRPGGVQGRELPTRRARQGSALAQEPPAPRRPAAVPSLNFCKGGAASGNVNPGVSVIE